MVLNKNWLLYFAFVTVRKSKFYPFLEIPKVFGYRTLILYSRTPFLFKYLVLVLMNKHYEFWPNPLDIFG